MRVNPLLEEQNVKAVLEKGILYLKAENKDETDFLDKLGKEGLRYFSSGSQDTLVLPSLANLTQLHLTPMEMALLLYCIGRSEDKLIEMHGVAVVNQLRYKIANV